MFREIPVLPVVIPLGMLLFAILIFRLQVRGLLSIPRAMVAAALSVYASGIVANTVFPIFLNMPRSDGPWIPPIALVPFSDYGFADATKNLLVFVPLGMLIPLLLPRPTWLRVLAIAAAVSFAIEATQFIAHELFAGGHIADINDFIFNVVGGGIGCGLFFAISHVPGFRELIQHFRWVQSHTD